VNLEKHLFVMLLSSSIVTTKSSSVVKGRKKYLPQSRRQQEALVPKPQNLSPFEKGSTPCPMGDPFAGGGSPNRVGYRETAIRRTFLFAETVFRIFP